MPRSTSLLESRWTSWLFPQGAASSPNRAARTAGGREDPALTAWCKETALSLMLPELSRKVKVSWNGRMQTTAGRAWWPDRAIELNPKLKDCAPEEIWRTLKHELAHLIAYDRCGRRKIDPHGPEWRTACAELGIPNEQPFHNLPFKRRKLKRNHSYICSNCFSTIHRVKPIRRAVACYACCRKFSGGIYHNRFRLLEIKN